MVYDRSESDEIGIRLTAEDMGIDLGFLPFHKVAVCFGNDGFSYRSLGRDYTKELEGVRVILNRTQSKSRRLFASTIFEGMGKEVLNPMTVEFYCQSKVRSLLSFHRRGVKIPETCYVPCNPREHNKGGGISDHRVVVSDLISHQLGDGKTVLKPDAGTHGRDVMLVESAASVREKLARLDSSIINPSGVIAQEFVPKWFYDLRILVEKEKGRPPICHKTALARGGFKEFRTNTFLGNMVFRASLPLSVRRDAELCGEALGGGSDSWVIALDAMPYIGDDRIMDEELLRSWFDELEVPFGRVLEAKETPDKKRNFRGYSRRVEEAYSDYMSTEAYSRISKVIGDSLSKKRGSMLFHEGNACPEFWEQTRIVGGVNLAESLLNCALSLIDR
jgi:glutathione synthase/RimK-type ligase-like ATP-grasp enzyme